MSEPVPNSGDVPVTDAGRRSKSPDEIVMTQPLILPVPKRSPQPSSSATPTGSPEPSERSVPTVSPSPSVSDPSSPAGNTELSLPDFGSTPSLVDQEPDTRSVRLNNADSPLARSGALDDMVLNEHFRSRSPRNKGRGKKGGKNAHSPRSKGSTKGKRKGSVSFQETKGGFVDPLSFQGGHFPHKGQQYPFYNQSQQMMPIQWVPMDLAYNAFMGKGHPGSWSQFHGSNNWGGGVHLDWNRNRSRSRPAARTSQAGRKGHSDNDYRPSDPHRTKKLPNRFLELDLPPLNLSSQSGPKPHQPRGSTIPAPGPAAQQSGPPGMAAHSVPPYLPPLPAIPISKASSPLQPKVKDPPVMKTVVRKLKSSEQVDGSQKIFSSKDLGPIDFSRNIRPPPKMVSRVEADRRARDPAPAQVGQGIPPHEPSSSSHQPPVDNRPKFDAEKKCRDLEIKNTKIQLRKLHKRIPRLEAKLHKLESGVALDIVEAEDVDENHPEPESAGGQH